MQAQPPASRKKRHQTTVSGKACIQNFLRSRFGSADTYDTTPSSCGVVLELNASGCRPAAGARGRSPGTGAWPIYQFVRFGHNLHHNLARSDHAADGVDRELVHDAVCRRAQIDCSMICAAVVFSSKLEPRLGFAQILHNFRAKIVICPDVLQFRFADLGFRLRDRRSYLTPLTIQTGGFARSDVLRVRGTKSPFPDTGCSTPSSSPEIQLSTAPL